MIPTLCYYEKGRTMETKKFSGFQECVGGGRDEQAEHRGFLGP